MTEKKCKIPYISKAKPTLMFCLFLLNYLLCPLFIHAQENISNNKETALAKAKDWLSTSGEKGFIENKGQMFDSEGKAVPFVLFKTEAPNVNIWITESGMTIQTLHVRKEEIAESEMTDIEKQESKQTNKPKNRKFMDWERIDLEFKGAVIKKENVIKENGSETNFNFFYGHCKNGIYGVKEYQKITIKNIYPNIDWVIYRKKEGEVKYDFVVHKGADYRQIELIYKSKSPININQDGQLELFTQHGNLIEKKPISFSQNTSIETQFKLNYQKEQLLNGDRGYESSISFSFNNFDAAFASKEDLIIDPDLVWATFYGGNNLDGPASIATDEAGNYFVTGYVGSSNFPTLNAAGGVYFQGTFAFISDIFILKFNNAGLLLWATYYGGSITDRGWFITTDVNGNVYVTGDTESTDLPVLDAGSGAYFQNTIGGTLNSLILKFNNAGVLLYATYFGGNGLDFGFSVCVDLNGNIFLTGQTNSTNFPTLDIGGGAYFQGSLGGSSAFNAFIVKLNNNGILQWSTYYGGNNYEAGYSVTTDIFGNLFVVGSSSSLDFSVFDAGAGSYFQANNMGGSSDAFILKFNNVGFRLWATYYGGGNSDEASTVITDSNGDVFITGKTGSLNFPVMNPGAGAYFQNNLSGTSDIFMLRFSNLGLQLWSTYYGGTSGERQSRYDNLAIDDCNNLYLALSDAISDIPLQAACEGGYFDTLFNGNDVYIAKFNSSNTLLWSTFIGGNGLDFQAALAVDHQQNIFVTGEWCGTSLNNNSYPLTNPGGGTYYDPTFNGGFDDGFVLKIAPTPLNINPIITQPTCANICGGEATINLSGTCIFNYLWSNGQTTQTAVGLCPGVYNVNISNSLCGGIDTTIAVTVLTPPLALVPVFSSILPYCSGAIIPALPDTSINGVSGSWSPAIDNSVTTLYTFTSDTGQCAINTTLSIQINPTPVANSSSNSPLCENQTLNLFVNTTSGAAYSWTGPNLFSASQQNPSIVNADSLSSGNYIVTVVANGCSQSDTINVSVLASINSNQNAQICSGQTYILPDGSATDTAGVFINNFVNASGCDSIITTTINLVNSFIVNLNAQICLGQSYLLPDGSNADTAGVYTFNLINTAGCDSIVTINLGLGIPTYDTLNAQICSGQSYTLPDGNIVTLPGIYDAVYQNQLGCDSIITVNLMSGANLLASVQIFANPAGPICDSTAVFFTLSLTNGGISPQFQWFLNGVPLPGEINDTLFITNLQNNDSISLQMNSNLVCVINSLSNSNVVNVTVVQSLNPNLTISANRIIICALQPVTFTATSINAGSNPIYFWYLNGVLIQSDTSGVFTNNTFSNGDSVQCSIIPTPICGSLVEVFSNSIGITVNPNPEIDMLIYEYWQYLGDSVQLTSATNISNPIYNWSPSAYLSCFDCVNPYTNATADTTQYFLTITDSNTGCFTNDSIMIYVLEDFDIFLPSGFSPNGDNINDVFYLRARGIKEFELNVYDRWGELIFSSNSLLLGWDGTFKGKDALTGIYVYALSYTNLKKENKFLKGNLTLVR